MEGTYPLPEAQMDWFFFQLLVPYPTEAEFSRILEPTTSATKPEIQPVMTGEELLSIRDRAASMPATPTIRDRAVRLGMPNYDTSSERIMDLVKRLETTADWDRLSAFLDVAEKSSSLNKRSEIKKEFERLRATYCSWV